MPDDRNVSAARSLALLGMGAGLAAASLAALASAANRKPISDFAGKVVLITGGSRGLGLAMAEEFAAQGANVIICARHEADLQRAQRRLQNLGAEVLAVPCDVGSRQQVEELVRQGLEYFGHIDVLVNNAGIIAVGPLEAQRLEDFHEAMDVMFWGPVYATLAVLPHMMERRSGRIVNITSIGAEISVPHLLPYNCAKFAHRALSEGLRAELARHGIAVTTVLPGLMRTGSYLNAWFKGRHKREFDWFAMGSTLPVVSMNARRAARQVVRACRRGSAQVVLSVPAQAASLFHGVFPGVTADLLAVVNRLLPGPGESRPEVRHRGKESQTPVTRSFLTKLGRRAARNLNQLGGDAAA